MISMLYRCPPILEILLRVLSAYMQACKVYLQNHMQANPILDQQAQMDTERRDLKNALIATQESAIIQILLECCLPREGEKVRQQRGTSKFHPSFCPFVCHKTLTWLMSSEVLMIEHWYLACKILHCVPRAPVCEVSSRPYLFAYCLNIYRYHTMHFVRFRHCRNATFKLSGRNRTWCIVLYVSKQ